MQMTPITRKKLTATDKPTNMAGYYYSKLKQYSLIQAMNNISSLSGNFPTGEDLTGAAAGLMRLQDTYKLDTKSMARGEFGGVKVAAEMSTQVEGKGGNV